MHEPECTDKPTPPEQQRIRWRTRTRSARTNMPMSSPSKREKLRPNTKVNQMTSLFTAPFIVPPSTPSQSAQYIRSRNRNRSSNIGPKHPHAGKAESECSRGRGGRRGRLDENKILTIYGGTTTSSSKTKLKQVQR
jgi:hypothetical protein